MKPIYQLLMKDMAALSLYPASMQAKQPEQCYRTTKRALSVVRVCEIPEYLIAVRLSGFFFLLGWRRKMWL